MLNKLILKLERNHWHADSKQLKIKKSKKGMLLDARKLKAPHCYVYYRADREEGGAAIDARLTEFSVTVFYEGELEPEVHPIGIEDGNKVDLFNLKKNGVFKVSGDVSKLDFALKVKAGKVLEINHIEISYLVSNADALNKSDLSPGSINSESKLPVTNGDTKLTFPDISTWKSALDGTELGRVGGKIEVDIDSPIYFVAGEGALSGAAGKVLQKVFRDSIYEFQFEVDAFYGEVFPEIFVIGYDSGKRAFVEQVVDSELKYIHFPENIEQFTLALKIHGKASISDIELSAFRRTKLETLNKRQLIEMGELPAYTLSEVRMALIADEFTTDNFKSFLHVLDFTPRNWKAVFEQMRPDVLFVESTWFGYRRSWRRHISHNSPVLREILKWCKNNEVPTVFWNKEDPVYFNQFISTAKNFDYIYTTDRALVKSYSEASGHDNVYWLPFGFNPNKYNPLEPKSVDNHFVFAGAYYATKYPERQKSMTETFEFASGLGKLTIYDRNFERKSPEFRFPEQYNKHIKGSLSPDQVPAAYKEAAYVLNFNSVTSSPYMFARRVVEALACGVALVSNSTPAIKNLFSDVVIPNDDVEVLSRVIAELEKNSVDYQKLSVRGLRKAFSDYNLKNQLVNILAQSGLSIKQEKPIFSILVAEGDHAALSSALNQVYADKRIFRLKNGELEEYNQSREYWQLTSLASSEQFYAVPMSGQYYYSSSYLLDFVWAAVLGEEAIVKYAGKDKYIAKICKKAINIGIDFDIEFSAIRLGTPENLMLCLEDYATYFFKSAKVALFLPGFECEKTLPEQGDAHLHCMASHFDSELLRTVFTKRVLFLTEADLMAREDGINLNAGTLQWDFGAGNRKYIYFKLPIEYSEILKNSSVRINASVDSHLTPEKASLFIVVKHQGGGESVFGEEFNSDIYLNLSKGDEVSLSLRLCDSGALKLANVELEMLEKQTAENVFVPKTNCKTLILTNVYPSAQQLYRNGFVHKRAKLYESQGKSVDVFCLSKSAYLKKYEFEAQEVWMGNRKALHYLLASGAYQNVFVHFLDPDMQSVLGDFLDDINVVTWIHGAESELWFRRWFNFEPSIDLVEKLRKQIVQSKHKVERFKEFVLLGGNQQYVNVSNWFKDMVAECDIGVELPNSHIIPNPVDDQLFSFIEKPIEQRKKVLLIRPFASRKYANDLAVEAILRLKEEAFFDELEFRLVGQGPLYHKTVEPLKDLSNVTCDNRFLTQAEIAQLHKEYGIFLCPTRLDAQGVSMCEAMCSGLVVVTNNVSAIPEYAMSHYAFLAEPEDATAIASSIKELYMSPELFSKMSQQAATEIRKKCGQRLVIEQELALVK